MRKLVAIARTVEVATEQLLHRSGAAHRQDMAELLSLWTLFRLVCGFSTRTVGSVVSNGGQIHWRAGNKAYRRRWRVNKPYWRHWNINVRTRQVSRSDWKTAGWVLFRGQDWSGWVPKLC